MEGRLEDGEGRERRVEDTLIQCLSSGDLLRDR